MSVDQQRKDNLACSDKVNHADLDAKPIPETRIEAPETIKQALTRHPWTIVWLVYGIWMVACNSFDSSAGSTVLGIPKFRQDYGFMYNSNYVLPAKWQSAYSGGPAAAQVIGTFMGGGLGDKIGRKWMTLVTYLILFIGITLEVVSHQTSNPNAVFFAGKFVNGFAIGALMTTAMTYIVEIAPVRLRGIFAAAAGISFCVGTLVLSLIVNAYGQLDTEWAYKSAFVTQYGVTGIALFIWPFMPESPTWLISVNKDTQAIKALKRLGQSEAEIEVSLATIKYTLEKAREESSGVTYAELFRKTNLRRTIIASMPLIIQQFSGVNWIAGYFTYYAQLAGYSTAMSYKLSITQQVLSMVGNINSWFLIESFGRRGLSLWGLIGLTVVLFIAGGTACLETIAGNRATVSLILIYCWGYNMTIGATAYVAMSEIGTSRLRTKTAAFSLAMQGAWGTMWSFTLPYLFNPNEANLGAKCAFIFGALSIICCVYFYYYHPETKGRSLAELDEMFAQRVPARKFATYQCTPQENDDVPHVARV